MKRTNLLLAATLAGNVALGFALWHGAAGSDTEVTGLRTAGATTSEIGARRTPSAAAAQTSTSAPLLWTQIESEDLDTLVARLRAAGFPAREVQEIARTVLMTRRQQRLKSVLSPAKDPPYWRSLAFGPQDREAEEKANAASREFAPLWRKLERLVRVPLAEDADAADRARERYGNLPLEKLQRAEDIEAAFEDRVLALSAEGQANTQVMVAQGQAYAQIKAEQDAALRAALSPEEYREYALRSSPTAVALRTRLALFQPTEAEYQALFDLYEPIERQLSAGGMAPWLARRAAETQLTSQVEAALGSERYADYVQAQQSAGDKLSRLMGRLELPLSTIGHINSIRDDITQRAQSIRANPQLTASERAQQLSGLAKEAATRLGAKLGDRGLSAYRDLKGDWLLDLEKR
ncbi:hypothetical protein [Opitutus sp. ER46]|uniref:hypothetical protein n=1 Tax=Opitutus sp. ER46 TaxID=2161864 RepID=UPI000D2F6A7E|nr:hypothetical protein [Opitutus sp. ER46]PTX96543.1 hypothetical protein DB354_07755 [Opitutus sp. ER46]